MSFKVPYKSAENEKEAFLALKEKLDPDFLSQFKLKIEVELDEENLVIKGKAKGLDVSFQFCERECLVELSLSLFLRPLKTKIVKGLQEGLETLL